ncbi:hypothetical protein Tco_0735884 [Tanacetum coccineum]
MVPTVRRTSHLDLKFWNSTSGIRALSPRRMTKRAIRISQSKALSPVADETAPPTRGDRYGEAFPTATSLDAGQDRENIPKTSAMPYV